MSLAEGRELQTIHSLLGTLHGIPAFDPSGNFLVATFAHHLAVFNAKTLELLAHIRLPGASGHMTHFDADGELFVTSTMALSYYHAGRHITHGSRNSKVRVVGRRWPDKTASNMSSKAA